MVVWLVASQAWHGLEAHARKVVANRGARHPQTSPSLPGSLPCVLFGNCGWFVESFCQLPSLFQQRAPVCHREPLDDPLERR